MTARVRPASPADGPALYRHWMALREYNAAVDRRVILAPVSENEFLAGFAETLQRDGSVAFVAEVDGELAGFISGGLGLNQPDRLPERHATVGYLWVADSFRRRGLGRELFDAVAGWAGSQDGVSHFEMPVLAADTEAERFWQAIGFTPFIQRLWAPLDGAERRP